MTDPLPEIERLRDQMFGAPLPTGDQGRRFGVVHFHDAEQAVRDAEPPIAYDAWVGVLRRAGRASGEVESPDFSPADAARPAPPIPWGRVRELLLSDDVLAAAWSAFDHAREHYQLWQEQTLALVADALAAAVDHAERTAE